MATYVVFSATKELAKKLTKHILARNFVVRREVIANISALNFVILIRNVKTSLVRPKYWSNVNVVIAKL